MKKRVLAIMALLLCSLLLLCSCQPAALSFKKAMDTKPTEGKAPVLTTAEKLTVTGTVAATSDDLVLFTDTDLTEGKTTYTVYYLADNKVLWTGVANISTSGTTTTTVAQNVVVDEDWFYVETTTTAVTVKEDATTDTAVTKKITLFDTKGTEIATAEGEHVKSPESKLDMIRLNGKVYRENEEGALVEAFAMSDLRDMPDVNRKVGEFYYGMYDEDDMDIILIYDDQLQPLSHYILPSNAIMGSQWSDITGEYNYMYTPFSVLQNGDVLIQYHVQENVMSEEYDYVVNGNKISLHTLLLNVERNKTKELELDYAVWVAVANEEENEMLQVINDKVDNIAIVSYIEQEHLDRSYAAMKLVSLSNSAKVKGVLEFVEGQLMGDVKRVAENRWVVKTYYGQQLLLNEKGKVLGEDISAMDAYFEGGFVAGSKIYDWDLNEKYDMAADGITAYQSEVDVDGAFAVVLERGVLIYAEQGEVYLYTNGEVKTIVDGANAAIKQVIPVLSEEMDSDSDLDMDDVIGGLYLVCNQGDPANVKYEIYNDQGTLLYTYENGHIDAACYVTVAESNGAVLLKVTDVGTEDVLTTSYIRLAG
ncbi:MAG: hypothetical protein IJY50_08140 [Clostridia bacterium]|nr:hypothetical protein [Clostridia bacterium]